jgi:PadR family transcriptional regulator PadR
MNKTTYLGEFEHMILLAIMRLGENAYGMAIRDELESRVGRRVTRSTAYITLERLVKKGYLKARMGEPSPERGGKAKRYLSLTKLGHESLKTSGKALMDMWAGYESLLEDN